MDSLLKYATWVEVDLQAVESNISYFCSLGSSDVMAVVKANAYGHGAREVAEAALRGGASWLAVARAEEAFELRQGGLESPIFLLGYTPPDRLVELIQADVVLTIWDLEQLPRVAKAAASAGKTARVHMKVDTGMGRLGVRPVGVPVLVEAIAITPGLQLEGIFTHLACADESDTSTTDMQLTQFNEVLESLARGGPGELVVHYANSAAALKRPGAWMDLLRVGIAMYGLSPSMETSLPAVMRPVLTWKSCLAQVKVMSAGSGISYGHRYTTSRAERIGTIPVGYADGLRRVDGNQVLVGGRLVPVVGRVTMDQMMVNLDSVPNARSGDEVVILGSQGSSRISAEDIAARWGTINYEVTSGIAARVPRVFLY